MASGSPWPSRSLHRVRPNHFAGFGTLALVCFVVLDERDLRRSRLRRHRSDQGSGLLPFPDLADSLGWSPTFTFRPVRRSISTSSFQRSPLHGIGSRRARVPRQRCRLRFGDRLPTDPACRLRGFAPPWPRSSTLPGYCTGLPVMGFVMFHRRDSESPPRVPTLRSLAPREQQTPSDRSVDAGPASPSPVSWLGSPRTLPPRPWPFARPEPRGFPPLTKP